MLVPVWLFATYLLAQYAVNERQRFEREAQQVAHQVSLVVEGELTNLLTVLRDLSKSGELVNGDLSALHAEAVRLVQGSDRVILLRDIEGREFFNTSIPFGKELPPLSTAEAEKVKTGVVVVSDVLAGPLSKQFRVAVGLPVHGPDGDAWAARHHGAQTSYVRDIMMPANGSSSICLVF